MSYIIISFTNAGYFDFCQNWYLTIRKAGITNDILVYCLDEKSIDLCNEYNIPCKPWLSESQFGYSPEEFVVQGSKQWGPSRIPFKKLEIINQSKHIALDRLFCDHSVVSCWCVDAPRNKIHRVSFKFDFRCRVMVEPSSGDSPFSEHVHCFACMHVQTYK